MKNSPATLTRPIGEIVTRLSGMQYVSGEVKPGEKVYLEREPDNPHDPNAIRVKNLDFQNVGFVPRQTNVWLSPLIDQGKIAVNGTIPPGIFNDSRERSRGVPLQLTIFLTEKGQSILYSRTAPQTDAEALQEALRILYLKLHVFHSAEVIEGLERRLRPILTRDVTPESHLILNLFSSRADEIRRIHGKKVRHQAGKALSELRLGEPVYYRNLTVFPLFPKNGTHADYLLLKNALESDIAVVEEVSTHGQVNELTIHNRGSKPILIPEGEILIGAKQNRVVNVSILVASTSSLRIPVSCVERGRWRNTSKHFQSAHYAHPKLRSRKLQSVMECRINSRPAYSDQGAVWEEVSKHLHANQVHSHTESLTDSYENPQPLMQDYRDRISVPPEASGVLIATGDRITGMDCFDSSISFQQYWERLSESYFADAVQESEQPACPMETARRFLGIIQDSIVPCHPSIGLGNELIVQDKAYTGVGVWYSGSLCHLSAFSID